MLVVRDKSKIEALIVVVELLFLVVIRKFLFQSLTTNGIWEWVLFSVAYLGIMPAITIKFIFKKSLSDYYLKGPWVSKKSATLLLIGVLLAAFSVVVLKLDWTSFFEVSVWLLGGWMLTLFIDILLLGVVVLVTDFFFRGFMLSSFTKAWGSQVAIIISTGALVGYLSILLNQPTVTNVSALVGVQFILTIIAALNRSIYLSALLYWALLILIDSIAIYNIRPLS